MTTREFPDLAAYRTDTDVEISGPFDMGDFFAPAQSSIVAISGNATTLRVALANGVVLEYVGTGLAFAGNVPTGGSVTQVNALQGDTVLASLFLAATPWNFADIATLQPYADFLATPHQIADAFAAGQTSSANVLIGGNALDFITWVGGADTIRGLGGDDIISIPLDPAVAPVGAVFDGGAGEDRIYAPVGNLDLVQATIRSIEGLVLGSELRISGAQIGGNAFAYDLSLAGDQFAVLSIAQVAGRAVLGAAFDTAGFQGTIRVDGTDADDRQVGNDRTGDSLTGFAGNDVLVGLGGNDTLMGGSGDDTLVAGADGDPGIGSEGDMLFGEEGDDRLIGGPGRDGLDGGDGNDTLRGGDGVSLLLGGAGDDLLIGGTGLDEEQPHYLIGGDGNDRLVTGTSGTIALGEAGDDVFVIRHADSFIDEAVGDGTDTVRTSVDLDMAFFGEIETVQLVGTAGLSVVGTATDNLMVGAIGADTLLAGDGADTLRGGAGDDVLDGGVGDDELSGGVGNDTFVFASGSGADVIIGFRAAGPMADVIDLRGLAGVTSFADLEAGLMTQVAADVVIDAGGGDVLILREVTLGQLDAGDFVF